MKRVYLAVIIVGMTVGGIISHKPQPLKASQNPATAQYPEIKIIPGPATDQAQPVTSVSTTPSSSSPSIPATPSSAPQSNSPTEQPPTQTIIDPSQSQPASANNSSTPPTLVIDPNH